jgi:hypothetical protein
MAARLGIGRVQDGVLDQNLLSHERSIARRENYSGSEHVFLRSFLIADLFAKFFALQQGLGLRAAFALGSSWLFGGIFV